MKSHTEYLTFTVPARMDFLNIPPQVAAAVQKSGVQEGMVLVKYKQAGLLEGRQEGLRESLLRVLERRFGPLAPEVRNLVAQVAPQRLADLLDRAAVAASLEDVPLAP